MIELVLKIQNKVGTDKISVEVEPSDKDANAVEKDVLSGLFPHIINLLNGLLGGEGFQRMEKMAQPATEGESKIVDKHGAPVAIPMNEEYLKSKGLIEPESGPETVFKDSSIIID